MRGLVLEGLRQVSYRTNLPWPSIRTPSDAVVEVRLAGLCGSDLHPYEGREAVRLGVVPGHEAVGEVVAVGSAVRSVTPGDRVLVPFTTSCATCWACKAGLSSRCQNGALFGYGPPRAADGAVLHGAQAELLGVPLADGTLVVVPEGLTDEQALLLTDNFPTGWYAVERADVRSSEIVAVVGLGAVGLCAVAAAYAQGARRVLGVDPVDERRGRAARLGAVTVAPDEAPAATEAMTSGRGFRAVIDAAGTEPAQALAFSLVQAGGVLSVIAVQTGDRMAFTPVDAYDANVTVRFGRAPVRSLLERILPRVAAGLRIPTEVVISHPRVALQEGPETYRRFAARERGLVKVAFHP